MSLHSAARPARHVDVEGMRLYSREAGEGPLVLLLHGGMATASLSWRRWFRPLARNHRVIAPDLRGHGRSDNPAGRFVGFGPMAWDMLRFIETLKLSEPPQIVAHSCGALVALHMAVFEPGMVARLGLLAAQPFIGHSPRYAAALREHFGVRDLDFAPSPLRFFRRQPVDGLNLALAHRQTAPWRLFEQLWPMRVRPLGLETADYAKITCPTLLMVGGADPFVSVEETARLCTLIPDATMQTLDGHDHHSALHDVSVVERHLVPFLD
ncbi:MAG: alpha/beta fold hydrolase [Pseudomonadota bacterium]